jgi:hypothetical protein
MNKRATVASAILGVAFLILGSCKKNPENSSAEQTGLFNSTPSTVVTIPATKERIDTRSHKLNAADKKILSEESLFSDFQMHTDQSLFEKNGVDLFEAFAIYQYSRTGYLRIRTMFEPPYTTDPSTLALYKAGISAINHMPKYQGPVFFGQTMSIEFINSQLSVGSIFQNNNFTSTSTDVKIALDWIGERKYQETDTYANILFEIERSCHGASIKDFSQYSSENEILFLPLQPWKVLSKTPPTPEKNRFHIKLQEMLPCPR